jgi:hypothetical protein
VGVLRSSVQVSYGAEAICSVGGPRFIAWQRRVRSELGRLLMDARVESRVRCRSSLYGQCSLAKTMLSASIIQMGRGESWERLATGCSGPFWQYAGAYGIWCCLETYSIPA